MSDDLLRRAGRALRDAHDGASERAAETRARVVAGAQRNRPRRARWMFAALPLAAALAATGVWAAATGRLSVWTSPSGPAPAVPSARASSPPTPPFVAAESRSATPGTSASAPDESAPPPAPAPPAASPSSSASHGSAVDADQAAYLVAHRAHFGGGDPAAALVAWDAYLRQFPRGRFAPEAHYNRALCLVRLGRNAEASQALEPFARGVYGAYRQQEARALLDAMGTGQ